MNDITSDELIRARLFADPEQVTDRLFALTQSSDDRVAVDAIRLVLDRAYGAPRQRIEQQSWRGTTHEGAAAHDATGSGATPPSSSKAATAWRTTRPSTSA